MVCSTEATIEGRTYYPGETISYDAYMLLLKKDAVDSYGDDIEVEDVFTVINEVNTDNGYVLTVDFSNPSKWDDYYRHHEDEAGDPIKKAKLQELLDECSTDAERKALLDSLKQAEEDFLAPLREENTLTESGLIVMEKTGEGKLAKMGDYVDFDFTMCGPEGDTIMNSFGVEPVEMQYGEEFIGAGFNEALGMVPEGGSMRFVIPSSLAFDSAGFEHYIRPYMPLVVRLRMNSVMDKEAYSQKMAALEAEEKAEKERQQALETQKIEEYIKANGITEEPTETGLYIIRQEEGEGDLVQWGDTVSVHYILGNLNGDEVESSYNYGQPISFKVGNNMMIPAIEEALMTMAPGAKVTLVSPSALAFGEYEVDKDLLPAYSPLVIELELVEIK